MHFGLDLEAQQAPTRAFAERRELAIVEVFTEPGDRHAEARRTQILRTICAGKGA